VDSSAWTLVPAGEFLAGLHSHETHLARDYAIMVTETTNAQYALYLSEALQAGTVKISGNQVVGYYSGDEFNGYEHEEEIGAGDWLHVPLDDPGLRLSYDGTSFAPIPGYENHPMVLVTWFGAQAYCEHYGWRLPTEMEWEKAARGVDGRAYPWGGDIEQNHANFYHSRDPFEKADRGLGSTTPVGFFNGRNHDGYQTLDAASPYGAYDMAGNVWEWAGDVYEDTHYRYMRGGGRADYASDLTVWSRNSAGPNYAGTSVGFRCVRAELE
jgi:formylglycine-generating enzyme required for sulfatase activity